MVPRDVSRRDRPVSELFEHFHDLFSFQDEVSDTVVADAIFQLVAEFELVVLYRCLEIVEQDIGVLFQIVSDLIKMCTQDEEGSSDPDQAFDHGEGTFHGVLYVGAFEQFVYEHQPFFAAPDLFEGIADALHFVEEEAFSFGEVVDYVDITEDPVEEAQAK